MYMYMYYIFNLPNIIMSFENGTNGQPPCGGAGANIMWMTGVRKEADDKRKFITLHELYFN